MNFMNEMNKTQDMNTRVYTENGALGYKTTGKYLLDLNFSVASLRSMGANQVFAKFEKAFEEDPRLAMRWLFFARDVRGGLGERRLFRICMMNLILENSKMVDSLVHLIPEYGRWDDLWSLIGIDNSVDRAIFSLVSNQLKLDIKNVTEGNPISLLAKWMPSINTSSEATRKLAKRFVNELSMTDKSYRKMLSELRNYLVVTEKQMSAKQWEDINYNTVPSKANLLYKDAFMRHDKERRTEYLESLKRGEGKINATTLFPHDIVHKYGHGTYWTRGPLDETVEQLWKNLPDYVQGEGSTMVVADGSGSMMTPVGSSGVSAWEVAHALAIYFAERSSGAFKNKYITFSNRPQFVTLNGGTLYKNIGIARGHSEVANTNIEAVFDLILSTAIRTHSTQADIPANILIISDMEFDSATRGNYYGFSSPSETLFETIRKKWERAGYQLPRLVFWNVNSRTGSIPVTENALGVALVSGFSPAICKIVLSGNLDPYGALVDALMVKRYDPVEKAIKDSI